MKLNEKNIDNRQLSQSTINRRLDTIRAARHHAVDATWKFPDLSTYRVRLTKKIERERGHVLSHDEIGKITLALSATPQWEETLFFFQLAIMTAARMAELIRMRW